MACGFVLVAPAVIAAQNQNPIALGRGKSKKWGVSFGSNYSNWCYHIHCDILCIFLFRGN